MDGLLEVLVVAGVFFLLSALGGGKRKPQARPRPDARRPQVPARPRPQMPASRGTMERAPGPSSGDQPASLTDALFAILRGEVPETAPIPPRGEFIPEGPEAVSLETLEPAGEASHERFEAKYVDHPATFEVQGARRVRRLRCTPGTARDAVVWMAILSKPKGLQ